MPRSREDAEGAARRTTWRPPPRLRDFAASITLPSSLILNVQRCWRQSQYLSRREKWLALFRVIVVEQLEPGELQRFGLDVVPVRIELEPRISPAIHVEHKLHTRVEVNVL